MSSTKVASVTSTPSRVSVQISGKSTQVHRGDLPHRATVLADLLTEGWKLVSTNTTVVEHPSNKREELVIVDTLVKMVGPTAYGTPGLDY